MRRFFMFALCLASRGLTAASGESLFTDKVAPALTRDCQGCHGKLQALSGLDLSTRAGLLKGGARGPAIVPGNPAESLLLRAIDGRGPLQMPPGDATRRLPAETVAAIRDWIAAGAPWPERPQETRLTYKEEDLWAFRPLRPFDPTKNIDTFLGPKAPPPADRRTLIRRVTFDLTGLPPAPEDVAAFVADKSPNAWEKLVDRLLASPRYGERWGRHWLDVVRYADSSGYSNDFERPNAWRYRDYVIRAFNQDKPYNRFIREQVAGDELYPGDPEAQIATGFLRAGPWEHTAMSVEAVTRQLFLDDVTHSTVNVFLGLTLGCARCHDHKFDPLPTRDYYRVQAVFATTEFARPKLPFLTTENTADLAAGRQALQARADQVAARFNELQRGMNTPEGLPPEQYEEFKLFQKHQQLYKESLVRFEPRAFTVSSGPADGATDGGPALKYPPKAQYQAPKVHILPGGNVQSPADPVTPGALTALATYGNYPLPDIPQTVEGRRAAFANWIANDRNPLTARVMVNRVWQYHFGRGIAADTSNLGKTGKRPTHPELLDWLAAKFIQDGWSVKRLHRQILLSAAYRSASSYADTQASAVRNAPGSPESPASRPSAPSPGPDAGAAKPLTSATSPRSGAPDSPGSPITRASAPSPSPATNPPAAPFVGFPCQRLDAEQIRDTLLAVSGELSLDAGGPGVFPQINEDVARQPQHRMGSLAPAYAPSPLRRQRNRRTIYTFQQRSLIDPLVEVFNGPTLDLSCDRRDQATVPTQAFGLFNSQFAHDLALAMAARLEREAPTLDARITRAFQLAFSRDPSTTERAAARRHFDAMLAHHKANPAPPPPAPRPIVHKITSELTGQVFEFRQPQDPAPYERNLHPSEVGPATRALADVALALFNTNEFVYVD